MKGSNKVKKDISELLEWVREAQLGSQDWRADSWRDAEMDDGCQWTQEDWDKAVNSGIDPVTRNRIFPVTSLIKGLRITNPRDIIAKARTQYDSEISQTMTEALAFCMDQNDGNHQITQAFADQVVPGIGYVGVSDNYDPRQERIKVRHRDWTEVWFDPFASPFLLPDQCRYVFINPWMDLDDLVAMFWEQESEIKGVYEDMCGSQRGGMTSLTSGNIMDEAMLIEDKKRLYGLGWVHSGRKRVRPVQMYYPVFETALFATFSDGKTIEVFDRMDAREQYQIAQSCNELIRARVRKMYACTFLGDLELQHMPTPYPHDEFPIVPFVCYMDRYKQPFGVPRQIRGMNEDTNKRTSMILAQLQRRRIIMEESAVEPDDYQTIHDEANKLDGMMVVKDGKMGALHLDEGEQHIAQQMAMLQNAEREIQEVSGANNEQMGYQNTVDSGVAIGKKQAQSSTITSPIFENHSYGLNRLGQLVISMIQGRWTGEKVLRVTDRITAKDKFIEINKKIQREDGTLDTKNNITQGKYDIVVSQAPQTDTVREKNLNLLLEAVKRATPEVVPLLLSVAFEMSDLPNKEVLMAKMRPMMGMKPGEEDMTADQIKQQAIQELEGQQKSQQEQQQVQQQQTQLMLENLALTNKKLQAEIEKLLASAKTEADKVKVSAFKTGADVSHRKSEAENRALLTEERKSNLITTTPRGPMVQNETSTGR